MQAWDACLRAALLVSALRCRGPGSQGGRHGARESWTGLCCARGKQSLTRGPGKPRAVPVVLTPVEGLKSWAPIAGLQDKQESPWGRKRRGQKGFR